MVARARIAWIDIAKGIGIVLMVVGHTVAQHSQVRDAIFSFHMPLFFILAGYTFRVKPMREMLASSAKTLLAPFFFVFFMRLAIAWVSAGEVTLEMLRQASLSLFMSSGVAIPLFNIPAAGVIWFLMALFWARLIINAGEHVFEHRGFSQTKRFFCWLAVGVVGAVMGVARLILPFSIDVAMVACLFMAVGMQMRRLGIDSQFAKWKVVFVVLAAWIVCVILGDLEMASRKYNMMPLALCGAVFGSYVVFALSSFLSGLGPGLKKALSWAGEHSLLVFCVHALDRFVKWSPFALTEGLPGSDLLASLARVVCDMLVAYAISIIASLRKNSS